MHSESDTDDEGIKPYKKARYVWEANNDCPFAAGPSDNNNNTADALLARIEALDDAGSGLEPRPSSDNCLARRQARQIAKGFFDNTVNTFLESRMGIRFDGADPDGYVEDRGILMAIRSHGLQSQAKERPPAVVESTLDNYANELRGLDGRAECMGDFLNAAVSAAIRKKGLSAYGY